MDKVTRSRAEKRNGVRVNETGRRTYAEDYKRSLVTECLAPGVSVAATGLKHGINPNLLRRWIRKEQVALATTTAPMLLPILLEGSRNETESIRRSPKPSRTSNGCIEIEIADVLVRVCGTVDIDMLRCVLGELRQL